MVEFSPIVFALISFLGWGIGDIFVTIVTRKIGGYSTTLWNLIFRVLVFGLYIPFALNDLVHITPTTFILNVALGVFLVGGAIAYFEGLRIANVPLVGTITASFSAVTVILSIIFLKERVDISQTIAILVIFLGLILSTLNFKEVKRGKLIANRGIFLSIVAMVSWGIYFTFIKIPVREIGWFWPNYISLLLFPFVFLFMRLRNVKLNQPNFKNALMPLIFAIILMGVADFSFNFAISRGLTAIVAPIAGSYPTLFALLAFLVFKDPIKKQQMTGIIITLIGIVFLSVFSV